VQPIEERFEAATAPDDIHHGGGHGGSCSVRQHAELLSLLAERGAALARMGSELAVARAALEGQAELPGEEGAVAQVCRGVWGGGGCHGVCSMGQDGKGCPGRDGQSCRKSEAVVAHECLHTKRRCMSRSCLIPCRGGGNDGGGGGDGGGL
jgi:hypothetical protein